MMAFEAPRCRWSAEARVFLRPTAMYRQFAARRDDGRSRRRWITRLTLFALMLGAFVSWTTTGRLTARLVFVEAGFWSVVPLLQTAVAATVLRVFARRGGLDRALDLFLAGNGSWYLWLLGISGFCLLAGSAGTPLPFGRYWLAATFVAALVASTRVRYAFFRAVLGLPGRRALAGLTLYNGLLWGAIAGYGAVSGQLVPRLAQYLRF